MGNESREPIQVVSEATAEHLGRIASIITAAVRDIAQELGKWANDVAAARSAGPEQQQEKQDQKAEPEPS